MKREFIINRQGKDFVLYAGLLDAAHTGGLTSLATEVITISPTLAVFKATATFADDKQYTAHGDATPENVGRNIAPHFIRMAETRAKARALRDALNIGAASLEELGDDDAPPAQHPRPLPPPPRAAPPPEPDEATGELPGPRWANSELGKHVSMAVDMLTSLPEGDPARRFVLPAASATDAEVEQWLASKRRLVAARKNAQ